jgi:hypothetical protein
VDSHANGADRLDVRGILEADLRRLAPGFEVVDRGLVLSTGRSRALVARRADLVLTDGAGTVLLALVVDGSSEEVLQAAVDALLFARSNAEALSLLRPEPPAREGRALVALIAEEYSERCLETLAMLPQDELWILEAKQFQSESGVRTVLVPVTDPPVVAVPTDPERAAFFARVPDPMRDAAESLLARLSRLGDEIRISFAESRATVRSGPREICALECRDEHLEAEAGGSVRPRRLDRPADAEAFLDDVIRSELTEPRGGAERNGEGEPLLTPEELAAFRD